MPNSQNKHNSDIIRGNNCNCINKKITIYLEKGKIVIEYLCPCLQNNNKDKNLQLKNSSLKIINQDSKNQPTNEKESSTYLNFKTIIDQLTKEELKDLPK